MSETGPSLDESSIEINENINLFLNDLANEVEKDNKQFIEITPLSSSSYLLDFVFNKNTISEKTSIKIMISFEEDKKVLIIGDIKVESQWEGDRLFRESLRMLIDKAKLEFSKILVRNPKGNTSSFWTDELGFKQCEVDSCFELGLK